MGLAAYLIGDLTVTSSDVFLLLLCPLCHYINTVWSKRAYARKTGLFCAGKDVCMSLKVGLKGNYPLDCSCVSNVLSTLLCPLNIFIFYLMLYYLDE